MPGMDSFLFCLIAVVAFSIGARDQIMMARMSAASGEAGSLILVGLIVSALTAAAMAFSGSILAAILPVRAQHMLVAFALLAAAIELAWPVKMKEARELGICIIYRRDLDGADSKGFDLVTNVELIDGASRDNIVAHVAGLLGGQRDLNWSDIAIWPGDDRIVPEDHAASNTGKIRAIFEPAGAQIRPLVEDANPPRFTFCWLGMGADGHIASLFPNTDPQVDDPQSLRRLTPDPLPPEAPFDRITLTIPALLNSGELILTLGGSAEKRAVFEAALRGEHDLPIARLLGAAAAHSLPVTCFT